MRCPHYFIPIPILRKKRKASEYSLAFLSSTTFICDYKRLMENILFTIKYYYNTSNSKVLRGLRAL